MTSRPLNWAGHSAETIAAMYETDAALRDFPTGHSNCGYVNAAANAEFAEAAADLASRAHMPAAQEPDLIKSA